MLKAEVGVGNETSVWNESSNPRKIENGLTSNKTVSFSTLVYLYGSYTHIRPAIALLSVTIVENALSKVCLGWLSFRVNRHFSCAPPQKSLFQDILERTL